MTHSADGAVSIRLPTEIVDEGLLDKLPSARVLPDFRSAPLGDVVMLASNVVAITSGLVTISVSYDQITALAKRIVGQLRRRHETQASPLSIEIDLPDGSLVLIADSDEAVSELIKVLQRFAKASRSAR
jgi:hypothetical protein